MQAKLDHDIICENNDVKHFRVTIDNNCIEYFFKSKQKAKFLSNSN